MMAITGRSGPDGVAAPAARRGSARTARAQRWLARVALSCAATAAAVLIIGGGIRSIGLLAVGTAGIVTCLVAVWWALTHRGIMRWCAAVLALATPAAVVGSYVRAGLLWVVAVCGGLCWVAAAAGHAALSGTSRPRPPREYATPRPCRPYLIMNPRSGGGKVGAFGLADAARRLGAEVTVLDTSEYVDVAALARKAVDAGADLLGVAGGDGTQALVAGIAAENGLPFMVISAGTRNHFALDLGLDRENPASCLDALTDGVELWIDLGLVGDRTFVNNASFGAYAALVEHPEYRDDKAGTALELLPDLLAAQHGPHLQVKTGQTVLSGPQAALVSNNAYQSGDVAGLGRRARLDRGVLGVLTVTIRGTADVAGLVRGRRSQAVSRLTAEEVVIDADAPCIPVAIDGEAGSMPTPVRCRIRPGALRVRVPRTRPGVPDPRPALDWTRITRVAGFSPRGEAS